MSILNEFRHKPHNSTSKYIVKRKSLFVRSGIHRAPTVILHAYSRPVIPREMPPETQYHSLHTQWSVGGILILLILASYVFYPLMCTVRLSYCFGMLAMSPSVRFILEDVFYFFDQISLNWQKNQEPDYLTLDIWTKWWWNNLQKRWNSFNFDLVLCISLFIRSSLKKSTLSNGITLIKITVWYVWWFPRRYHHLYYHRNRSDITGTIDWLIILCNCTFPADSSSSICLIS